MTAQPLHLNLKVVEGGYYNILGQFDEEKICYGMSAIDALALIRQRRRFLRKEANSPLAAVPSMSEVTGSPRMD